MSITIATLLYKFISLFCGTVICWMGYRLFSDGIIHSAGDAVGKYGNIHIMIKSGAPGTFFVVLGCFVLSVSLFRGMSLHEKDFAPSYVPAAPTPPAHPSSVASPIPVDPAVTVAHREQNSSSIGALSDLGDQAKARALHYAYIQLLSNPKTKPEFVKFEPLKSMRDSILLAKFDLSDVVAFQKSLETPVILNANEQKAAQKVSLWLLY